MEACETRPSPTSNIFSDLLDRLPGDAPKSTKRLFPCHPILYRLATATGIDERRVTGRSAGFGMDADGPPRVSGFAGRGGGGQAGEVSVRGIGNFGWHSAALAARVEPLHSSYHGKRLKSLNALPRIESPFDRP
jgi:hypothetical protein